MSIKRVLASTALVLAAAPVLGQQRSAGDIADDNRLRDAWIDGKVEMAYTLNEHLNPFDIETDVDSGVITLTGTVESDIVRDLAAEIAAGVDGVVDVNNDLRIGMPEKDDTAASSDTERRSFPDWFDDATTTAAVKTNLIRNSNTKGLQIDVDTNGDVVTLSGSVRSEELKALAGEIAANTGDVEDVRNLLVVAESS